MNNGNPNSFIRFLHASPDAPPVDIYANGILLAKNMEYRKLTDYLSVPSGDYNVKVFPTGQRINPVISTDLFIPPRAAFTIAATGSLIDITPLVIEDEFMPMIDGTKSYVRFAHLSPNAPAVDIALPDGTVLFANTSFSDYTDYLAVDPGTYTLLVRPAGSEQTVLTVPELALMPGSLYTVYALGFLGEEPRLEAFLFTDSAF